MKYVDARDVCKLVLIDVMILCLWVVDLRFLVLFVKVAFEMVFSILPENVALIQNWNVRICRCSEAVI